MHTASQLPGILRWFEVVETESITLNPIEAAIDTMDNKNKELRHLVAQYSTECAPNDLNPLTMRLNGNIDAAVGGGIAKYQEVKLNKITSVALTDKSYHIAVSVSSSSVYVKFVGLLLFK